MSSITCLARSSVSDDTFRFQMMTNTALNIKRNQMFIKLFSP